ncbi:MAG: hypothetical protein AAF664_08510 [Planctomycetota bacterium]
MATPISEVARRADLFFMNRSPIHEAMQRLHRTLSEMDIRYAVAGAMAANAHGHRRTTADVDILIRPEDLQRFKDRWIGRGWVDKFEGSKNFRDAVCEVDIDDLLTGGYPGDGLEKPVRFPEPESVSQIHDDGIPYIDLPTLLNLKLASGMTASHRPRDLDDAIQLIRGNQLDERYSQELNEFVRAKYLELLEASQVDEDF